MLINNFLINLTVGVVLGITTLNIPTSTKAEEIYKPPQMFQHKTESQKNPAEKKTQQALKKRLFEHSAKATNSIIIKPQRKPNLFKSNHLQRLHNKALGVSKTIEQAQAIKTPSVEKATLLPTSPISITNPKQDTFIETSIAFLPSGIDLTHTQKSTFSKVIKTYFIERNAQKIVIKTYASPTNSNFPEGAKRKAFARGLSIRDWLKSRGVESNSIKIEALGEPETGIPNRADIKIIF